MHETYKIIRVYKKDGKRTIETGLTLEQAQAHCRDPETSSRTCTKASGRKLTEKKGPWYDAYDLE